jgi:hypothetical protein
MVAWWKAATGTVSEQREVFEAIARGDERAVAALLERSLPLTTTNEQGCSLVHWATITRQTRIAALLVTRGVPATRRGPAVAPHSTTLRSAATPASCGCSSIPVPACTRRINSARRRWTLPSN